LPGGVAGAFFVPWCAVLPKIIASCFVANTTRGMGAVSFAVLAGDPRPVRVARSNRRLGPPPSLLRDSATARTTAHRADAPVSLSA